MISQLLLALTLSWLIGLAVVILCFQESFLENIFLKAFLGLASGLGLSSCLYFLFSLVFDPSHRWYFLVEGTLLVILLFLVLRDQHHRKHSLPVVKFTPLLTTILVAVIGAFLAVAIWSAVDSFSRLTLNEPHGRYDAWAIWLYRARFIYRGGVHWLDAVSPLQFHADYPLLVPLSISRLWLFAGEEVQKGVILLAGLFTFGGIGLLAVALAYVKKLSVGLLGAFFLATASTFIYNGSILFADVPLSFFILSAAILTFLAFVNGRQKPGLFLLAGLNIGLCGWVKNEGFMFMLIGLAVFILVRLITFKKDLKAGFTFFGIGTAVPLFTILYFKIFLSAQNDLVNPQNLSTILEKITDPDRYKTLYQESISYFSAFGGWETPLLLLLLAFITLAFGKIPPQGKRGFWALTIILTAQWIGYYAIYLITPFELVSHFRQSILRLIVHTYPAFLFFLFLLVRYPEDIIYKILPPHMQMRDTKN